MSNKMVIIGVGGTGAILVEETKKVLGNLENKGIIPEVQYLVIDTSESNKRHADDNDVYFHHISKKSVGGDKLSGAGGLRKDVASDVKDGVVKFLNDVSVVNDDPKRTFYVVVGSLGGGSGSTIGPIVANMLMQENRNVLVIASGDDCSMLNASNTKKTLQLYNTSAVRQDRALTLYYVNENANNKGNVSVTDVMDNIEATNILMVNAIQNFAVFISGNNMQIDETEIAVFLNPVRLESEVGRLPRGIYIYDYFVGEEDFSHLNNIVSARILSLSKDKLPTLSAKNPRYGIPYSEYLVNMMEKEKINPFVITASASEINTIIEDLDNRLEELKTPIEANKVDEVAEEDDFL